MDETSDWIVSLNPWFLIQWSLNTVRIFAIYQILLWNFVCSNISDAKLHQLRSLSNLVWETFSCVECLWVFLRVFLAQTFSLSANENSTNTVYSVFTKVNSGLFQAPGWLLTARARYTITDCIKQNFWKRTKFLENDGIVQKKTIDERLGSIR